MRELSLFSGAGGGLLGTKLLGWEHIGYVEFNEYCQKIIRARIDDGILDEAPIFTDVREFIKSGCADQYRGIAEVVTAGFPCQPFSVAGKQGGAQDDRNMWPATCETIQTVQPRLVLLENVKGLTTKGYIIQIERDLRDIGYEMARPVILGPGSLGGDHRRERVWILAYPIRGKWRPKSYCRETRRMGRVIKSFSRNESWEGALSSFRGMDDGMARNVGRTDSIRNGQVPVVVKTAWQLLTE